MKLTHLQELESEAMYVLRETAAQFERPVLLFSGGKDSAVVAHLAKKAFYPAKIPFPFLHVDTGHNFQETIDFRDNIAGGLGVEVIVASVEGSIKQGRVREEAGIHASRNKLQAVTLLDALQEHEFDAAIGGARRDEDKARAKERFFSHRDSFGQWNPKNQRAEPWSMLNGRKRPGEHFRIFPISNWTELDVWQYIAQEGIDLPSLYFSHTRKCFERGSVLLADEGIVELKEDESPKTAQVRFRTIGDVTCTGAVKSNASTVEEVIRELEQMNRSERGGRADDKRSETAMEDRKKQGYF